MKFIITPFKVFGALILILLPLLICIPVFGPVGGVIIAIIVYKVFYS